MTIAFLINSLGYGGAERVFIDDANRFAQEGYSVFFFILYGTREKYPQVQELDSRISLIELKASNVFDLVSAMRCIAALRTNHVSMLISTLNDGNIFARWVRLCGGPRLMMREANALSSKTRWQRLLDTILWWVPYRVLAVSSEVRDSLVHNKKNVLFFPNGVSSVPLTERLGHVPLRILCVGSLTPQKDYPTLLAAFGTLARTGADFAATIIGRGELLLTLQEKAKEEGIAGHLEFAGALPHAEVLARYASSDIFVLSSRWEGSPNVVLEAMAAGLPVVATQVGGIPDFVLANETGLLVPAQDSVALGAALGRLIQDAALRNHLGHAGRERIARSFSAEARFARLRAIVEAT